MKVDYNKFSTLPFMPNKMMEYLFENNENIWKILKYPTSDCLSKPNLSMNEKVEMIWGGQDNQQDFNIFFTKEIDNMFPELTTILKLFTLNISPDNHLVSTVALQFDIICGGKISVIDYMGIPCNRIDVLRMELLGTLNGENVLGIGELQFNNKLSRWCGSMMNIGNDKTFTGATLIFATQVGV